MTEDHKCPHCGARMDPITSPLDSSWGGEIHYVCFDDDCSYFIDSWNLLDSQGVENAGYRCRLDARGQCGPMPVWSKDALKDQIIGEPPEEKGTTGIYDSSDFQRDVEGSDLEFYKTPRTADHLDSLALSTVEDLFARVMPAEARILDLMSSHSSHLPENSAPASVTGLGLNMEELEANPALTERVIHDLNADPVLPFEEERFDCVLLTVSIQYVTKPIELFREAARVLSPGGLFIVVFSNRMFPPKAVKIWKETNESERNDMVRGFFARSDRFVIDGEFESKGKPRPEDDKYYDMGIPSDPIYAVWGRVSGGF